jgi:catechol 2,3-dioxygenase-like lactoylglutathione lyase family enzyme
MEAWEEKPVKTHLGHVVVLCKPESVGFFRELFEFLEWKRTYDDGNIISVSDGGKCDLWIEGIANDARNDYDGVGLNHLAVVAERKDDVDAAADYLRGKGVEMLFGTPCNRPEHASSENDLYYSVMFHSPDRILLEVVYTGPK